MKKPMLLFKSHKYIESSDLLQLLIPSLKNPNKIEKGYVLKETHMLYRESLTTLLTQIFLTNTNKNKLRSYEIWKYETPKEGDGRIDVIEDKGKWKQIILSIEIEQVFIRFK
jgi:hypothetical protein